MFETPGAKRIKRSESRRHTSPSPRPSGSPLSNVDDSSQQPAYAFDYEFIDASQADPTVIKDEPPETQKFVFRLFASTTKPDTARSPCNAAQKATITLRTSPSPSNALSEGRFLKPNRPETYYFTFSLPASLRQQYRQSAISSSTLIDLATSQQWPGTALPWRVVHLNHTKPKSPSPPNPRNSALRDPSSKRSKPNKKRRLQTRRLLTARKAAASTAVRATETAEEKEKALREKKAAKNRKVQLKRRERERRRKAELKMVAGNGEGVYGADAGDGSENAVR